MASPTDGIGVAAYITLSGSNDNKSVVHNTSGGANKTQGIASTLALTSGTYVPSNAQDGQGIGAGTAASGTKPCAQYSLTLSLGAKGGYAASLAVTAMVVDVLNSEVEAGEAFVVAKSYNNPSAGSPAWYRPSNFAGYSPDVASVGSVTDAVFTITALNPGVAIVEVESAVFDNNLSSPAVGGAYPGNTPGVSGTATAEQKNPNEMIYVQIVVTVIP